VQALVVRDLPAAEVDSVEKSWKPHRQRLAQARRAAGRHPEHAHWDWTGKTELDLVERWRFVAVRCDQSVEGLMAARTKPKAGRLAPGPILYVDFVEVAPWNSRTLTDTPRFQGVGALLIQEAVAISVEMGWDGRLGLSALPQAQGFYARLGMTLIDDADPDYSDLAYFEFEPSAAKMLLTRPRGGKP
jgi:GNAT superfamily N-acetyltransferase